MSAYKLNQSKISVSGIRHASTGGMRALSNSSKVKRSTEFSKQLESLRKPKDQSIEDDYIKNLQQQIAYMELELKLLKEKEIEQKESVGQIDKFFNDGVPLNENILALKNQYNAYKKEMEHRIEELREQNIDEEKLNIDLKNEYDYLIKKLEEIEMIIPERQNQHEKNIFETDLSYIHERNYKKVRESDLKKLQEELKVKNDQNLNMNRKLERDIFALQHERELKKVQREKTLQRMKDKDEIIMKLRDEVNELNGKSVVNPDIAKLENENLELQSRTIQFERECNMTLTKIKEMELGLEIQAKERQIKAEERRELTAKINDVKNKIDEENKVNELIIGERVKAKQNKIKQDIEKQIEERIKEKHRAEDHKSNLDQAIETFLSEKVKIQQDILDHEQTIIKLTKDLTEAKDLSTKYIAEIEHYQKVNGQLEQKIKPINDDLVAIQKTIDNTIPKIENLKESIDYLLQQERLALELKNVNLEELKVLSQSNNQVYETLLDLTKKWEHIQRTGGKNPL